MRLLEIDQVKNNIKILGIEKVLNKIKENKGYLRENDFRINPIINQEDTGKYISYNMEINNFYIQTVLLQMEKTKKSCTATSLTYFIKNVSHTGYITYANGRAGVMTK